MYDLSYVRRNNNWICLLYTIHRTSWKNRGNSQATNTSHILSSHEKIIDFMQGEITTIHNFSFHRDAQISMRRFTEHQVRIYINWSMLCNIHNFLNSELQLIHFNTELGVDIATNHVVIVTKVRKISWFVSPSRELEAGSHSRANVHDCTSSCTAVLE